MNYIKHLSAFFELAKKDKRLLPHHISLYMALFYFWNLNRFENPFLVYRTELLKLSKIGSLNTYHKCLRELHEFGYLKYNPSHNPMKGSSVHLYNFDTTLVSEPVQLLYNPRRKIDITLAPIYKHNKHINYNSVCEKNTQAQESNPENMKTEKWVNEEAITPKRKKVGPKKEKGNVPADIDEVLSFFRMENYPELEGRKFFNHFQSNGWKVGGKAPMKDWQAAARNWMLNTQKFTSKSKPGVVHLNNNKNYNEPL